MTDTRDQVRRRSLARMRKWWLASRLVAPAEIALYVLLVSAVPLFAPFGFPWGVQRWALVIHVAASVILVPALERVYPALTSQFVLLMLVTSLLSAVGTEDLFGISGNIQALTFRNFEVFVVLWVVYLAMSALVRGACALAGKVLFVRKRKLGTPL